MVIVPVTLHTEGAVQMTVELVDEVMVPSPLLALQPGVVAGPALAALENANASPAAPTTELTDIVALVSAQMPTDTSTPLILVSR
jgi:hypothetical protein